MTYEATKILQANIAGGTGTHANIGCPAGGKTGTTDLNTDAWFVGFTPRLSTAVWVGYPNDRTQMNGLYFGRNVDGGTFPADIWGEYMKHAKGSYCGDFRQPKEPFVSTPFSGEYASSGGNKLGFQEKPDEPEEPEEDKPEEDTTNPGGGTEFDPEQYEAAPQPPPDTDNGGDGTTPP